MEKNNKEGAFLVDVRTPAEFAEGHVKDLPTFLWISCESIGKI
jgi:rhodanese-related sulfurtransferase